MLDLITEAFRGRRPATASVHLTDAITSDAAGNIRILALSDKGALTLVIDANRAETREGADLVSAIRDVSGAMVSSSNTSLPPVTLLPVDPEIPVDARDLAAVGTLEVEGVWRSQSSLDPDGTNRRSWNFHVARWHDGRVADRAALQGGYAPRLS